MMAVERLPRPVGRNKADAFERRVAALAVGVPTVGAALAVLCWDAHYRALSLGLFAAFFLVTQLGITMGYHRLFAHRSFVAAPWLRVALAVLGSMAAQGPVLFWVAAHRRHHKASDTPQDPHSPRGDRPGLLHRIGRFAHAHVGWMFMHESEDLGAYARDLLADRRLVRLGTWYGAIVLLGLALPAGIAYLATGTAHGALLGLLWGGLARIFVGHHVTWSVNSLCHTVGSRPFRTNDLSTNNALVGVLALGEGWHNNHHAFPTSARHGLRTWQVDLTYIAIAALRRLGQIREVQLPDERSLGRKRIGQPEEQGNS